MKAGSSLQERSLDPLDFLVSLQHQLWHRLPSAPALLQQPDPAPRRTSVRGPEPRGEVEPLTHPPADSCPLLVRVLFHHVHLDVQPPLTWGSLEGTTLRFFFQISPSMRKRRQINRVQRVHLVSLQGKPLVHHHLHNPPPSHDALLPRSFLT